MTFNTYINDNTNQTAGKLTILDLVKKLLLIASDTRVNFEILETPTLSSFSPKTRFFLLSTKNQSSEGNIKT